MSAQAKLTGPACRAARALLKWTTDDLARAAGVSASTISKIERGGVVAQDSEARIVAALRKKRVEITNGDGTGARLRT